MTTIEIPESVTSIGYNAFGGCTGLNSIDVDPKSTNYLCINGVLFKKESKRLIKFPEARTGDYSVPAETISIDERAFHGTKLNCIRIGESVKFIGYKAFLDSNISELHLKNKNQESIEIEDGAFNGLENCTLYVPIGTGYRYRHDERFKDKFKEIIIEQQEWQ